MEKGQSCQHKVLEKLAIHTQKNEAGSLPNTIHKNLNMHQRPKDKV